MSAPLYGPWEVTFDPALHTLPSEQGWVESLLGDGFVYILGDEMRIELTESDTYTVGNTATSSELGFGVQMLAGGPHPAGITPYIAIGSTAINGVAIFEDGLYHSVIGDPEVLLYAFDPGDYHDYRLVHRGSEWDMYLDGTLVYTGATTDPVGPGNVYALIFSGNEPGESQPTWEMAWMAAERSATIVVFAVG